jgi:hypothetical protein
MIKGYARRLSSSWPPMLEAKEKLKVAPALHRCSKCDSYNYEGDSHKNYDKYVLQFSDKVVNFDGIEMDHISPIVPVTGWTTWDNFFDNTFCDEINYRGLCNSCHAVKTKNENSHREIHKKKRKQ